VVLTAPVAPASAQRTDRPHRSGLWGEFGAGAGRVRIACSGCTAVVVANAPTSYVRIGGTVSDRVVIGLEVFSLLNRSLGFAPGDSTTTAETATVAIVVLWFPSRRGFFFKGGAGLAAGQFTIPGTAGADTSNGRGIGVTYGFGWDFPLSRKFAITTNFAAYVTAIGDVVLPGRRVDDMIATMYQAGIGITFR
jgi:hypothetical protein